MMATTLTLQDILDDAAFLSLEHQLRLEDLLGTYQWQVDLATGTFTFTGDHPITCTRTHLLGSAAPGPRTWLWSWAPVSQGRFDESLIDQAVAVQKFGAEHGVPPLTSPEVGFAALPNSPTEPAAAAGLMINAAKIITHTWTSFCGDAGGGTQAALLIEHPEFALPAPDSARVARVLYQGIADMHIADHRRAVHSYATWRPLAAQWNADYTAVELTAPDANIAITFDEHGRIGQIQTPADPS